MKRSTPFISAFLIALICCQTVKVFASKQQAPDKVHLITGALAKDERASLTQAIIDFQTKHQIQVFIIIDANWKQPFNKFALEKISTTYKASKVKEKILLGVDLKYQQSILRVRSDKFSIPRKTVDNLNRQFIVENLKNTDGLSLSDAISGSLLALDKLILRHKEIAKIEKITEETSSSRYSRVAWANVAFAVIFLAIWGRKSKKPGKDYERRVFYPLSRVSDVFAGFVGFGVLCVTAYWLYDYIFFYEDLVWAYFFLFVGFVPMTTFCIYSGLVIKDAIKARKIEKATPLKVKECGIVPLYLLMYPKTAPSVLLEKTFFSLILQKMISLELEWRQFGDGREKVYTRIAPGPKFNMANPKDYEKPFLTPLVGLNDGYSYYLKSYIVAVNKNITGLKYFEKDLVSTELLKGQLIEKKSWLINRYVPTALGSRTVGRLQKHVNTLKGKIGAFHGNKIADQDQLTQIDQGILLLSNFKRVIGDLQGDIGINAQDVPLGPLLDINFDLNEFEEALESVRTVRKESGWEDD